MSKVDPLQVWMWISQIQLWFIPAFVIVSFFIIIKGLCKLRNLRRSQYYLFLISIVIADLITIFTILVDVFSQTLINFKGPALCKILVFLSNAAACFINWTWLGMFLQRFILLIFPFCRARGGVWRLVYSAKHLLTATFLIAITTQSWSLVLLTERYHETNDGKIASVCERDTEILGRVGYKWVAIIEALSTYVCPFCGTLVLDLGVLIWTQKRSKGFSVSSEKLQNGLAKRESRGQESTRIQSSQSIRSGAKRRQRAIRRCLFMCTIQVLLNAPYYVLQLLDEVYQLSITQSTTMLYFVYADALLYIVYLVQYPIITFYINSLCDDVVNKKDRMPVSSAVSPMVRRSFISRRPSTQSAANQSWSRRPSTAGQSILLSPNLHHKDTQRFDF